MDLTRTDLVDLALDAVEADPVALPPGLDARILDAATGPAPADHPRRLGDPARRS